MIIDVGVREGWKGINQITLEKEERKSNKERREGRKD